MGFADSIRRFFAAATLSPPQERVHGPPTSPNGASSHHLFWRVPRGEPVVAVAATIEIIEPPLADRLYFWALQASFCDGPIVHGAGHLGLQHHPRYPGAGAANWGGYHDAMSGRSGELEGSPLAFPSTLDNPNTCDFPWRPHTPYRLEIARVPDGWAGSITDLSASTPTAVTLRILRCAGGELRSPMVWTESFADCDAPPAAVRWRDLTVRAQSGVVTPIDRVAVNYQTVTDGGCSTSESRRAPGTGFAIDQWTGEARSTPGGTELHR